MRKDLKYIDKGLNALIKSMSGKQPFVKVGVLGGSKSQRQGGQTTNALVGAVHEFGSMARGIPSRSWLRMPLAQYLPTALEMSQGQFKKAFKEAALKGSLVPLMWRLAGACENVCKKAFTNGGYGKWAKLKPATLARKENKQILVETAQLMKSVQAEVVK